MDLCVALGAEGAVIHTASAVCGLTEALPRISNSIERILTEDTSLTEIVGKMLGLTTDEVKKHRCLILENCAGEGNKIGRTIEEMSILINSVKSELRNQVTVCLDTCHLYAAGAYDLSIIDEVKKMFNDIDTFLPNKVHVIHLNDSKMCLGKKKDRHSNIRRGEIWKHSEDALVELIRQAAHRNIPLILESPEDESEDLKWLKSIQL